MRKVCYNRYGYTRSRKEEARLIKIGAAQPIIRQDDIEILELPVCLWEY